jgi:hypothetical protein
VAGIVRGLPRIDDRTAENGPGCQLKAAWVTLNIEETHELCEALSMWAEDAASGEPDPQWHMHITDAHGNELTIATGQTGAV